MPAKLVLALRLPEFRPQLSQLLLKRDAPWAVVELRLCLMNLLRQTINLLALNR